MTVNERMACPICGSPGNTAMALRRRCCVCAHQWMVASSAVDYGSRAIPHGYGGARAADQCVFLGGHLREGIRILEMGCAAGGLASHIRGTLRVSRYDGIEISRDAGEAANYIDHIYGAILDVDCSYDLVIFSHVLEHLDDPVSTIACAGNLLKPSGIIFVEVPNGGGHPSIPVDYNPGHVHVFSPSSLMLLLREFYIYRFETGAYESVRYPDCMRAVAGRMHEQMTKTLFGHLAMAADEQVIVWGAGGMTSELILPYFDVDRIAYFVDRDLDKHGQILMGRPVLDPKTLTEGTNQTVLISSLDYEQEIRAELQVHYAPYVARVLSLRDLLSVSA